jgi:dTDP-4-dehydrorhamnose 3,5-epimerase
MNAHPLADLPDVLRIELRPHGDARGFFVERWRADHAAAWGLPPFVQLNHSRSGRGTLRGLHFQAPPHAQGKLVGVARGSIYDVVVDLRVGSPSYGRWAGTTLDDDGMELLWVPPGFAHGFLVTSELADVLYHVDVGHAPASEGGLAWDDPELGIPWPLPAGAAPILSPRDTRWPRLADLRSPFTGGLAVTLKQA